jgi:hypothetical protein
MYKKRMYIRSKGKLVNYFHISITYVKRKAKTFKFIRNKT